MTTNPIPVLIVGAGPTGLSLAHELLRSGVPFRIIDMVAERGAREHRATGVHARSLDAFHRYGARDQIAALGLRARAFEIYSQKRLLVRFESGVEDDDDSQTLVLPQSHIEKILIQRLSLLGKAVERPVELVGLAQDAAGATATLRHADGSVEDVGADFIAGCDGGRSTVRRLLGLEFPGKKFEPAFVMDAHVTWSRPIPPGVIFTSLGARSMVNIGEIQHGVTRVVIVVHPDDARASLQEPSVEMFQSVLDEHPRLGVTVREVVWSSAFHLTNRMVAKLRHGRVMLIGDAAHIHSPFGGQGMNTGIQDAANLGWKLSLVSRGLAGEALLDSVDPERLPRIRQVLWATERLQRVYMMRNPAMRLMRDLGLSIMGKLRPVVTFARRWNEQHTVSYAGSPVVSEDRKAGRPRAGAYVEDVAGLRTISADPTSLHDILAGDARSHLLLFGSADDAWEIAADVETEFPAILKPWVVGASAPSGPHDLSDPANAFGRRWGRVSGMVLIRPDGYVGFRAGSLDRDVLLSYLEKRMSVATRGTPLPQPAPSES
jgi:2-polyprenyl-6-methoxyphenol hydroxylase-like FAD-dependent oxidoreductase